MKRYFSRSRSWWLLLVAAALLFWGWSSLNPSPTGALRVVIKATEKVRVAATINKGQSSRLRLSTRTGAHEWDQVVDLPLNVPKVSSVLIELDGEEAGPAVIKSVMLLDKSGTTQWTAPDGSRQWNLGEGITLGSKRRAQLSYWPALGVLLAGGVLLVWQVLKPLTGSHSTGMAPGAYAMVMAAAFAGFGGLYLAGIEVGKKSTLPNEGWVPDLTLKKIAIAKAVPGPNLLMVGGSSALYGIDTATMSQASGRSVINLGTHGGLPLSYHLDCLRSAWKKGDSVVFHLEYSYWNRTTELSTWLVDQSLSWGAYGSFEKRLASSRLDLLKHVPPDRLLAGLIAKANPQAFRSGWQPLHVVLPYGGEDWTMNNFIFQLNDHGDLAASPSMQLKVEPETIQAKPFQKNAPTKGMMEACFREARELGIQIFVAFPASILSPKIDFTQPPLKAWVDHQLAWSKAHGVTVLGLPQDTQQPAEFFLDTTLHLNPAGREIHTKTLLRQLREAGWPGGEK